MERPCIRLYREQVDGAQTDRQMLTHPLLIEGIGHTGQFDFAVQWFVGGAEQGPVGHAVAIAVGGDRRRFHVDGDSAGLVEAPGNLFETPRWT